MCHRSVLHPPLQRVALPDAARCVFLDRIAHLFSWWVPRRRRADSVSFRSLVFEMEKAAGQISSAFSFGLNIQSVEFARPFPSFLSNGSISLSCSNIRPLSTLVFPQNCVTLYASCPFWLMERLHEHYFSFHQTIQSWHKNFIRKASSTCCLSRKSETREATRFLL